MENVCCGGTVGGMKLSFTPLIGDYAITRLTADAPLPNWMTGNGLVSMTRAEDEVLLSVWQTARPMPPIKVGQHYVSIPWQRWTNRASCWPR